MRFFEDYKVGAVERFGRYEVTRDEVIDFAARYDPQPFHLDDAAAAANPIFGRLAASGWHTAAMAMRMLVDHEAGDGSLGGAGIEELSWLKPVYPGDILSLEVEVIGTSVPRSRADIGFVKRRSTTFNQDGEAVMRQVGTSFHRRRKAGGE